MAEEQQTAEKQPAEKEGVEKARRRRVKLPTVEEARHWVGLRVDGIGGRTIGRAAELLVDAEKREPCWVVIRLGPLAGCTAIPFEHVAEGAGRLWAAYERGWVREAPRFKPREALTADQELELCGHWGIREGQGRSGEISGRDAEQISAVPVGD
jgi:hypothetical protein